MDKIDKNRMVGGNPLSYPLAGLMAIGFAVIATAGETVYRNDFTTRVSSGALPRIGETYTATPYPSTASRLYPYHDTAANNTVSEPCLQLLGYKGWLDFSPAYYYNSNAPSTGRSSVDGWFQPYFSKGTATEIDPLFHHTAIVYYDNGDPCFRFGYNPGSNAKRTGVALKSIHNVFTNGQLRIQVDFKCPGKWTAEGNASFFMFPVYDRYMDIESWRGEITNNVPFCAPGLFGMRCGGDTTKPYLQRYQADDYTRLNSKNQYESRTAGTQFANNYSGDNRMPWLRYVVTFDLDAGTMSGTAYSLSDWTSLDIMTNVTAYCSIPHPTFDTAANGKRTSHFNANTAERWVGCAAGTDMASFLAERGGISGIGFFVGKVGEGASNGAKLDGGILADAINKPMADNIRVSWKAPGADDFVVAYEDDFSSRSYTVLSTPSSAASAAYPAPSTVTKQHVDTFTGYVQGKSVGERDGYDLFATVPAPTSPYNTTLQPVGVDGWRQIVPINKNPHGRVWTRIDYFGGDGENLLEFGAQGGYACLAQPIGEEVTSGKVVLRVDAHLPGKYPPDYSFKNTTCQRLAAALGSSALRDSLTAAVASNTAGGGGIYLEEAHGVTNHVAFSYGSATALTEYRDVEIGVDEHAWYRYELVADIDAQTYDFTITPLETTKSVSANYEPTASPIVSQTGLPFASAVPNIGAFYLWGYGYGGQLRYNSQIKSAFDNIKIWKVSSDAATTNLLYSNDFETRARYYRGGNGFTYAATRLAYQYDRDDGPDHWIRRNGNGAGVFEADATIRAEGGNQYLSIGRTSGSGHAARYTTSLGKSIDRGIVTVTADMRPPKHWFGASGGSVFVTLGNKMLEQSEATEADAGRLLRFGFRDSTGKNNGGIYEDMTPCSVGSSDGTTVGTGAGAYSDLGETVDGAGQKWYRFVAKVKIADGTYSISVYDMGTSHPSPESTKGALVGSASGLYLMNPIEDGISSLDIECRAVSSTLGETGNDPLQALIDNIEVTRTPCGFTLIVK